MREQRTPRCGPETEKPSSPPKAFERQKGRLGHSEQIALYEAAKRRQSDLSSWMIQHRPDLVNQARKLQGCASLLIFHDFYRLDKTLLRGGITCKQHLLCNPCALRRSASLAKAYHQRVLHLLDTNPDWCPILITKTIRNSDNLAAIYTQFHTAHKSLLLDRRHALDSKSLRLLDTTILQHVHGAVGSYEYKRGKNSGLWHPHSHEIALVSKDDFEWTPVEISHRRKINGESVIVTETVVKPLEFEARLSAEWKKLTGGSWIVDVRLINADDEDELRGAVQETMGYALKMQDLAAADQIEAYEVLNRRRLTYTYGCLRNVELPDEAFDDDEIPPDEPWLELQYRWQLSRYLLSRPLLPSEALVPEPPRGGRRKGRPLKNRSVPLITKDSVLDFLNQDTS